MTKVLKVVLLIVWWLSMWVGVNLIGFGLGFEAKMRQREE